MGRFERDENEAGHLPETLGIATEGLRSTIEVEVAKIVERAEARATEIEDRALEQAGRLDQESDRRMGAVFEDSRARLGVMFAEIESVERTLGEAVRSLRAEAERLTGELSRARTEPLEVAEPAATPDETEPVEAASEQPADEQPADEQPADEQPADEQPADEQPADEQPADEQPASEEPAPEQPPADEQPPAAGPNGDAPAKQPADPAVRELIRQQLVSFAEGGRTRSDAERMLLRFKQGDQYFDLLDDIYPDETPGRRGLLRRRKKGN